MSVVITVVALAIMLALNALYVAAEFATVGARKSRIQSLSQDGNKRATKLFDIVRNPVSLDNYVATCQVGITISSLVAGAFAQSQLTPVFEPWFGDSARIAAVLLTLFIITSLQVILGELLPKTAALRYPERLAIATLPPMRVSQLVFKPLVWIFNGSAFAIMRALKLNTEHSHAHVHSPEELAALFNESAAGGLIDMSERDMVAGVLNVEQRLVREIMTPRRRVVGIKAQDRIQVALDSVAPTPHSRFPVWGTTDDEVVGMVHLRTLYAGSQAEPDATVQTLARPMLEVAETMTVPELWRHLNDREQHTALVINEYGAVGGMVTLEDAIEEIFGEVRDEFDIDPDPIVVDESGRTSVSGEVLLEDLNHRLGLSLPTDEVDTIGGLIWHELGRPATVGENVALGNEGTVVHIDAVDGNAIVRVSFPADGGDQ